MIAPNAFVRAIAGRVRVSVGLVAVSTLVPLALMTAHAAPAASAPITSPVVVGAPVTPLKRKVDPASASTRAVPASPKVVPEGEPLPAQAAPARRPVADPRTQLRSSTSSLSGDAPLPPGQINAPKYNVAGITSNSGPPDTIGDVGRNHYIQMVNATQFRIFNKDGSAPAGAAGGAQNFGALWPAGSICSGNAGDPTVVYDHFADRWLLSQFANPNHMCIAISQTPDPTAGTWFLYTFNTTVFPDYPKIGVWPDGYYMSTYESPNLGVYVFDRANMLLGNAAGFVKTTIGSLGAAGVRDTRILPADVDGAAPPANTPGLFLRSVDHQQDPGNPTDRIEVYEAAVNWNTNAFTFTLVDTLAPLPFDIMTCNRAGAGVRSCIPQPGEADTIDALSNRPMMQLKYRNFGTHQAMVFNQTIDVAGSIQPVLGFTPTNEVAGIRWYELRKTAANWAIQQEGTYAPQPNGATAENQLLHRWMGSMAMDRYGNLGLGYSIVNSDATAGQQVFPGIRYTGRRADDVAGLLPQGEQIILNGTAAQGNGDAAVNPQRWGDYSALSVDPVDDCTFYFTTHATGGITRVAAFQFSNCATDLSIAKTSFPNVATAGGLLTYRLTVTNNGPLDASSVRVVDVLPAGVTYVASTANCVQAPAGTLTCQLGNLATGASTSFDIQVNVGSGLVASGTASITNTATVSADQTDYNSANDSASVTTLLAESADVRITKQCKPDLPAPTGSTARCTIFVDNLGVSAARNVVVKDTLLSNGSFTILGATPAGSCVVAGSEVTCTFAVLAAGASISIAVDFTSSSAVDVNDTATVTSSTPDPNLTNNIATGRVSFFGAADLGVTKTDSPDPVVAGTVLTYTMTVTNAGPSAAPNVVVEDVLPLDVRLLSATPSVGTCGGSTSPGDPGQPLTCNLGTLANGASANVVVQVTVNSNVPQGRTLVNNVTVRSDFTDPNNANNKATATTAVLARADIAVVKTSDAATYKPSSLITYTITATNNGPSKALAVVAVDNLPTVKQAIYQSDTGGCTKSGTTLTCQLGDMEVGATRSFNINMVIKGSRGNVGNTVTVTSPTTDTNLGNNVSTRIVGIGGGN
jgi:uncharacterized repeat protein (TIGR01451 family)